MTDPTPIPVPRPWQPTPLLGASLALHAGTLGVLALQPRLWPWALGALAANHLTLTAAGLWPRSQCLGPNWVQLPPPVAAGHIALTLDDGPDPAVTPDVLDLLDRHQARASFFCIGAQARRYPELCRRIVAQGHTVENHGYHHYHHFATLGPRRMAREIERGQDTLAAITGQWPHFFRPTAGLRNPFLAPILARQGLHLASWTRRGYDTRDGNADAVLGRLTRHLAPGDILLLHDGHAARTPAGQPVILAVLPRLLAAARALGLETISLRAALARLAP
jgi:peptidoglycan-N-acetylglucosamine deacetylase